MTTTEELLYKLRESLVGIIEAETINSVESAVLLALDEYELIRKERSLIVYERTDEDIINRFFLAKAVTSQQVEYSKLKGYSDDVYCSMILDVLKNSPMTRSELNNVLLSQLPESLDEAKKLRKIGNLLRKLRVSGKVKLLPKKKWSVI